MFTAPMNDWMFSDWSASPTELARTIVVLSKSVDPKKWSISSSCRYAVKDASRPHNDLFLYPRVTPT